jgi:hypothetical protein
LLSIGRHDSHGSGVGDEFHYIFTGQKMCGDEMVKRHRKNMTK